MSFPEAAAGAPYTADTVIAERETHGKRPDLDSWDDDEDLVQSLSGLLCDEGFNVSSTADGIEALTLVRTVAPAVVLLDVWLPGMDGVEILQALQAMHADVEVIVMSGHGNIATAVHMTKLGAFDYLEKPLSLYGVLVVIKRALEHRDSDTTQRTCRSQCRLRLLILPPDSPQLSLTACQEAHLNISATHP